jgi:transposase
LNVVYLSDKVSALRGKGPTRVTGAKYGKPIAQVARELGMSDSSIHQWRKELAEHGLEAFPGSGHQTALEEENRRLKRELERTRQERDMLKNTVGIFSHGQL